MHCYNLVVSVICKRFSITLLVVKAYEKVLLKPWKIKGFDLYTFYTIVLRHTVLKHFTTPNCEKVVGLRPILTCNSQKAR